MSWTGQIEAEGAASAAFEQWPEGVSFGVLRDLIGYALRRAQIAIYRDFFATVGASGITPPLFAALVLIAENPSLNQSRLGEILGVNRAASKALVDRLADLELVERQASPQDRRANSIRLTPHGQARLDDLSREVRAHDARVALRLAPEERALLRDLLGRF